MRTVHNRMLVLGAVSLTRRRVRNLAAAAEIARESVEPILAAAGWFPDAPFSWVGIVFRLGTRTDEQPTFESINLDEGDLPISFELDTEELAAVQSDVDALARVLRRSSLRCLLATARRYDLESALLEQALLDEHAV